MVDVEVQAVTTSVDVSVGTDIDIDARDDTGGDWLPELEDILRRLDG